MFFAFVRCSTADGLSYPIVDTGVTDYYDDSAEIVAPNVGAAFYGQDAHYAGAAPAYAGNGDGTVSDAVTGLMWQADPGDKMTLADAEAGAASFRLGGYDDWRLPTIKDLYSLILFTGIDPDATGTNTSGLIPFIDTNYFAFEYGDTDAGERIIDSQFASSTRYVSVTMGGDATVFGVNFADGRIKGYPVIDPQTGSGKTFFVLYVRGATYGVNGFEDNADGTITDHATGLMWMEVDSGALGAGDAGDGGLNWQEALAWAEGLEYANHTDWRLPDAKELQSLLDYTRSPATSASPAIDPLFQSTSFTAPDGLTDFPFYWSGSTHVNHTNATAGAYVAFGRGTGWMQPPGGGDYVFLDVHGAGCQRSDPKSGDPAAFPYGRGPQGDVVTIYNTVRCVRNVTPMTPERSARFIMAY